MASKKPKIAHVWWRGTPGREIAWGRVERHGKPFRQSLETTDPKVARLRVAEWLKGLEGQKWGEKPRRSYTQAADRFIDEHLPRLKPRGAQRYLQSLQHLPDHFEGKMLDDITSSTLSDFESKRRRQGVTSGTIRNDLWCLSAIFTCAMEWEWAPGNAVAAYIRARGKRGLLLPSPSRTRYLGHEEELELLSRCKGRRSDQHNGPRQDHIMLAAGIALTIDIGLRKEELLAGEWPMVDLEANQWTVPKDLAKSSRKTGRGRQVPILPRSQAILRSLPRSSQINAVLWYDDHGIHRRYFDLLPMLQAIASGGRTYTFRREATKLALRKLKLTPARRSEIADMMEAQAWAPAIPDLVWHDLRRTCGCRLLQDHKLSIERVSKWLGHASIEQTQKAYAFLDVQHLHDAVGTGGMSLGAQSRHTRLLEASQEAK